MKVVSVSCAYCIHMCSVVVNKNDWVKVIIRVFLCNSYVSDCFTCLTFIRYYLNPLNYPCQLNQTSTTISEHFINSLRQPRSFRQRALYFYSNIFVFIVSSFLQRVKYNIHYANPTINRYTYLHIVKCVNRKWNDKCEK